MEGLVMQIVGRRGNGVGIGKVGRDRFESPWEWKVHTCLHHQALFTQRPCLHSTHLGTSALIDLMGKEQSADIKSALTLPIPKNNINLIMEIFKAKL